MGSKNNHCLLVRGVEQLDNEVVYDIRMIKAYLIVVKNLPAFAGDTREVGLIHGSRRSLGVGNGNLLQYS